MTSQLADVVVIVATMNLMDGQIHTETDRQAERQTDNAFLDTRYGRRDGLYPLQQ